MTAKQKAARAKFKAVVEQAKKLRANNPKLTQAQAVKQAWAISKGKKPGKIADVIVTYPSKKEAEYKMKRYKDGTFKGNERIAAAPKKKAAKKAVKKSAAKSYHKDTHSHNVRINVLSGVNLMDPEFIMKEIEYWQKQLDLLRAEYRSPKRKMYKASIMSDIRLAKKWLENYKKKMRIAISKIK